MYLLSSSSPAGRNFRRGKSVSDELRRADDGFVSVQQDLIARVQGSLFANDGAVVGVQHITVCDFHDTADLLAVQKHLFAFVSKIASFDVDAFFGNRKSNDLPLSTLIPDARSTSQGFVWRRLRI